MTAVFVRQVFAAAALALAASAPAAAQSGGGRGFLFHQPYAVLNVRFGYDQATAGSDLFSFVTTQHTLSHSDFGAPSFAADLAFRITSRFDVALGVAYAQSSAPSEFRDFIDNNNQPIEQTTTFKRVPVTGSLKFYVLPRGTTVGHFAWVPARWSPYVGAGAGMLKYDFRQSGDFIDFGTMRVFPDEFHSSAIVPSAHAFAGLDISLNQRFSLTTELRYTWARAPLDNDYVGFGNLDLSGVAATGGLSLRL